MKLPRLHLRTRPTDAVANWWARSPRWTKAVVVLVALALAIVVPQHIAPKWQSVLFFPVGIFVLLALGLNIVVGFAGLLDLGYVAFYAVGAYTAAVFTTTLHTSAWAALPFAVVFAVMAGVLLGAPTLRLRGDYLAIVTLGFGEIVRIVAQNTEFLGATRGISGISHPESLGNVKFKFDSLPYYYLVLAAVVIAIVATVRLSRSRVGRSWAAVREDEDAAEAMGVPTFKMKLWAFAVGASTGGLAGWLYATKVGFINPDGFPFILSVLILSAVVLGGMGSIPGVIAGAIAVAFVPEYLRNAAAGPRVAHFLNLFTGGHVDDIAEYRVLLFGAALVVMMVFRPQGLLPSRQRAAELAEPGEEARLGAEPEPSDVGEEREDEGQDQAQDLSKSEIEGPEPDQDARVPELGEVLAGAEQAAETVLELDNVTMEFGGLTAMSDVSISVRRDQIFGIIGPNGAGKTTLLNVASGMLGADGGKVIVGGVDVSEYPPELRATYGLGRSFQQASLFPGLTVTETMQVAMSTQHRVGLLASAASAPWVRAGEGSSRKAARALLERFGLTAWADVLTDELSTGTRRICDLAAQVASVPKVLLLDEPTGGVAQREAEAFGPLLRGIRDELGLSVLIVEHDMPLLMGLCDHIYAMDQGRVISEGTPEQVRSDPAVIVSYLGTEGGPPSPPRPRVPSGRAADEPPTAPTRPLRERPLRARPLRAR